MCLKVTASCLLINIMYRAKKLKKTELYEAVENVCDEVGRNFSNSYCANWGDSIPYMLECLEGGIKPEGDYFVYTNENRFNKKFIDLECRVAHIFIYDSLLFVFIFNVHCIVLF